VTIVKLNSIKNTKQKYLNKQKTQIIISLQKLTISQIFRDLHYSLAVGLKNVLAGWIFNCRENGRHLIVTK
jgi:hypothetical protein